MANLWHDPKWIRRGATRNDSLTAHGGAVRSAQVSSQLPVERLPHLPAAPALAGAPLVLRIRQVERRDTCRPVARVDRDKGQKTYVCEPLLTGEQVFRLDRDAYL